MIQKIHAPTESEVNTKLTELVNAHNAKDYRRQSTEEYPTLEDQLDDLYHNFIDAENYYQAVKDKYPKGKDKLYKYLYIINSDYIMLLDTYFYHLPRFKYLLMNVKKLSNTANL